jgi:hypothetical protein
MKRENIPSSNSEKQQLQIKKERKRSENNSYTKIEKVENDNNLRLGRSMEPALMKKQILLTLVIALGLLSVLLPLRQAVRAQGITPRDFVAPAVFQAAGTTTSSIQSTVDAFRAALGNPNNGNNKPPAKEAVTARSTGTAGTLPTWPR